MTTDAKIGLLLALVFIVAITFVINGLPDFLNKKDKSQDTVNYVSHYKPAEPGIVGQSRNIAAALNRKETPSAMAPAVAEANIQLQQPNAAYQTILPAASEVVNSVSTTTAAETVAADIPATTASVEAQPVSGTSYVVTDGDRLSDIAIKFYGPKEGKKFANVQKIYEANKKTLKSIDSLQVGQKLVIPPLNEKEKAILKTGLFEKVVKETKPASAPAAAATEKKTSKPLQEYVIKEQDTLWKIAAKFLGDGNRYEEIAKLNESVIKDTENLVVGTKIKIPAK
jgi:nucleoid-associated protein YgaU